MAYSGRLPDSTDFPEDNVEYVREQIHRLIRGLSPRLVLGSAAAGADLLVIEAALETGAQVHVWTAGSIPEFRASSVTGRGDRWEALFDSLITDHRVRIATVDRETDDDASYVAVNLRILSGAREAVAHHEEVVGLSVSAPREKTGHSEHLTSTLERHRHLVLYVDPTRPRTTTPTGFVAMPFGRRRDVITGWNEYEADETYKRIILPALTDAGYRPVRADAEALLEVIDLTVLRALSTAEVVVADLATLNPNVMWEVGVRHAWRRTGTILLRPNGMAPPFDISHARVHDYRRNETTVSDTDAVAGIAMMRRLLNAVSEHRVDSPVFATFPELSEAQLERLHTSRNETVVSDYMEAISLDSDLGNAAKMGKLARKIESDRRLAQDARQALLEQLGIMLAEAGCHAEAARVLGPIAALDVGMKRIRLQQQYAHALIRSEHPIGREKRLLDAERRLRSLANRSPTGETLGLLGSAAKARVEDALAAGNPPGVQLDIAIDAYLRGFQHDPGDYYPGIVALALLRLRGQRITPNKQDIARARQLLPVVHFAATRFGEPTDRDLWRLATVAELHLHDFLLCEDGPEHLAEARRLYSRMAAISDLGHRASVARQLRLLRNGGDPPDTINPLLHMFDGENLPVSREAQT